MAKKTKKSFEGSVPQIDFLKYLLDNKGRVIDDELIDEIIKDFAKEIIVRPALNYIMARQ